MNTIIDIIYMIKNTIATAKSPANINPTNIIGPIRNTGYSRACHHPVLSISCNLRAQTARDGMNNTSPPMSDMSDPSNGMTPINAIKTPNN